MIFRCGSTVGLWVVRKSLLEADPEIGKFMFHHMPYLHFQMQKLSKVLQRKHNAAHEVGATNKITHNEPRYGSGSCDFGHTGNERCQFAIRFQVPNLDAGGSNNPFDWIVGIAGEIFVDQKTRRFSPCYLGLELFFSLTGQLRRKKTSSLKLMEKPLIVRIWVVALNALGRRYSYSLCMLRSSCPLLP